jgi:O-antigen/teichoic acid export membrane protein
VASRTFGTFLLTGASDTSAFQKSVLTGVATKAVGFVNQVVGLSLVARALGAEGLASVLLSISLFSILNLVASATIVSLPPRLIAMRTRPDEGRRLVAGALAIHLTGALVSLLAGVVSAIAIVAFFPGAFLSPGAVLTAGIMGALYIATWLAEHVLTAYRRTFIFNLTSLVGSLFSLGATVLAYLLHEGPWAFVAAYYLSIVVPTMAMFAFVWMSELRPTAEDLRRSIPVARELMREGAPGTAYYVWVTTKIHIALATLALVTTPAEVVAYGACMRVCQLMISGMSLFFSPLLAESSHAVNDGDLAQFARLRSRVISGSVAFGIAIVLVASWAGPALLSAWLSHTVVIPRVTAVLGGAVVAIWAFEALLFYLTSALRVRERLGRDLIAVSVLALASGLMLASRFGAPGFLAAIAALSLFVVLRLLRFDAPLEASEDAGSGLN